MERWLFIWVHGYLIPSTSGLVSKIQYDSDKQDLEAIKDVDKNISNTLWLVKKTDYGTKITDIENKIPTVTGLVTATGQNTKFK